MEGHPSTVIVLAMLVLSFALSAIFSSIKIVFTSIAAGSIPSDDEYFRFYCSKVESILHQEPLFSSTVSFERTFANCSFTLLTYLFLQRQFPAVSVLQQILTSLLVSIAVLTLFGYEIPRALAKKYYRTIFTPVYAGYRIFGWLFLPFVSLFTVVHRKILAFSGYDERFAFLSDTEQARISEKNGDTLDKEEKEMIRGIFDLSETTVEEIMVPRIDIKGFDLNTPLRMILGLVREEGHSRLPVFRDTIDSVVGVLYAKDILSWLSDHREEEWNVGQIIKKPLYVPVGKKVNELMSDFKKKHMHLAIVVDEYGGTAGLITMEDILEQIVGDIQDEYDEEEKAVIRISDRSFYVDPHIDLDDLGEEIGVHLNVGEADYTTLSGLIYNEYGDIPQKNVSFIFEGLRVTILEMDNQRIDKVKIEVLANTEGPASMA